MMSLETLIQPELRSDDAIAHVNRLIEATQRSALPQSEVSSIVVSLKWLRTESIGQAGRRLVDVLQGRRYMDEAPARFFTRCYEVRSKLVHGAVPRPT
jgi:hypothetical protein